MLAPSTLTPPVSVPFVGRLPSENVIVQSPMSRDPDAPIVICSRAVPLTTRFTVPFHVPVNGAAADDGLTSENAGDDWELQAVAATSEREMSQRNRDVVMCFSRLMMLTELERSIRPLDCRRTAATSRLNG